MACIYNGIFAKISNYYVTITYGLLQLMHFNALHLSAHNYPSPSDWIPGIIWNWIIITLYSFISWKLIILLP